MPTIKELPNEDCPREKALKYGFDYLSNAELLAIIIGSGTKNHNAIEIAQTIVKEYKGFKSLLNLNYDTLNNIKGIGTINSLKILSAIQIAKRLNEEINPRFIKDNYDSKLVFNRYAQNFINLEQEKFLIVQLDKNGKIIHEKSFNSLDENLIKVNFETIIKNFNKSTKKIILIHNHIKGDVYPSFNDVESTILIGSLLKKQKILLLDHLIIYQTKFFSFSDENLLDFD